MRFIMVVLSVIGEGGSHPTVTHFEFVHRVGVACQVFAFTNRLGFPREVSCSLRVVTTSRPVVSESGSTATESVSGLTVAGLLER